MKEIKTYTDNGKIIAAVLIFIIYVCSKIFDVSGITGYLNTLLYNHIIEYIFVIFIAFCCTVGFIEITGSIIGLIWMGITGLYNRIRYGKKEY